MARAGGPVTLVRNGTIQTRWVYHAYIPRLIAILAFAVMLTACKKKPPVTLDLRSRIAAANPSQYCHKPDACFNPGILAIETGYVVTIFVGNKPQSTTLRAEALRDHLLSLPMSAWPEGPKAVISPSDDVYDSQAVYRNLKEAEQVCRSLGLDVETSPGG
jgi:hypothetical protein